MSRCSKNAIQSVRISPSSIYMITLAFLHQESCSTGLTKISYPLSLLLVTSYHLLILFYKSPLVHAVFRVESDLSSNRIVLTPVSIILSKAFFTTLMNTGIFYFFNIRFLYLSAISLTVSLVFAINFFL